MASIQIPTTARAHFTSGSVKATPQQLITLVRDIIADYGTQGAIIALNKYNIHVARKDGALRKQLKKMILDQFVFSTSANKITINFDMAVMAIVKYAKYHIDRKPHRPGDTSPYADPTLPGTRPIQKVEILREVKTEVRKQINIGLRASGLQVR